MKTIYLDVLISINLFINYLILLGTSNFLNIKTKRIRLILAAILGSIYSLMIFLDISFFISLTAKIFFSVAMILISFGFYSNKILVKSIVVFYTINLIFFGIMFLLWIFVSPPGLLIRNNIIYFNISPIFLAFSTLVSYLIFVFISKTIGKQAPSKTFSQIFVEMGGRKTEIKAKIDTGNTLKEPFSSLPVIVAEYERIKNIVPQNIKELLKKQNILETSLGYNYKNHKNCRIVPFKSVSGEGILPAFKPDKIYIKNYKKPILKEAYIAVSNKKLFPLEFEALISEEMVN
ncbi:MAG: sigma-E processing peptidase SpoIIGA [Oscillospiraceae bacterium]|jgi:stage II sporulation protein GA (sporulation sigma-E factor processing peptidase)|nr:sigma-E processing peptidase SpoIIGA [Oscillospiraceae bacterium]